VSRRYDLQAGLRFWQRQMRLQDWSIGATYVRGFESGTQTGRVRYALHLKQADIEILDPIVRPGQDVERTLVHELGHLHFAPMHTKEGTAEDTAEDQAVEAFALALVGLRRATAPRRRR